MLRSATLSAVSALVASVAAGAQHPGVVGPVAVGFGVDTSAPPVGEIVRRWTAYLGSSPESPKRSGYWIQGEQDRWRDYDLTGRWVYQGFTPTVVEVVPAVPDSSVFVVKTLYARAQKGAVYPIGLQRVYATRGRDGWRFANALPRATADWRHVSIGPLRYAIEPGAPFRRERATAAARFVADLAKRFGVGVPVTIDYIVARSPETMVRAIGLDWVVPGTGGRAYPENRLVLSGSPTYGEAYLHELVHIVLAPLSPGAGPCWLASEGLATWLGGSQGKEPVRLFAELAAYQAKHPALRLTDVFDETDEARPVLYSSAALLFALVHERGGDAAVRQLVVASTSLEGLRSQVRRSLAMSDPELEMAWRAAPLRMARGGAATPRRAP